MWDVLRYAPRIKSTRCLDVEVGALVREAFLSSGVRVNHYVWRFVGKRLLPLIGSRGVVLTYENRAWENAFVTGLEDQDPDLPTIGYQHTVVFKAAAGYFIGRNEKDLKPLPTRILTVGQIMRNRLVASGCYDPSRISVGGALRFEYLGRLTRRRSVKRKKTLLLVLEGVVSVNAMISFVLSQANEISEWQVKIRCHPELPWAVLARINGCNLKDYPNVSVSDGGTLFNDLNWCAVCMYWGSTVSIEALHLGIPLINFDGEYPIGFDPLEGIAPLKWTINPSLALKDVLSEIISLDQVLFDQHVKEIEDLLPLLFEPVSDCGLRKFVP